jgi:hypothetical protein
MRRVIFTITAIIILLSQLMIGMPNTLPSVMGAAGVGGQDVAAQVEQAILDEIARRDNYGWGTPVYQLQIDNVKIAIDGTWATAWVVYYDAEMDQILPTEPGMVVARLEGAAWQSAAGWRVYLPQDAGWLDAVQSAPGELITQSEKEMWAETGVSGALDFPERVLSGFHLPWEAGKTVSLSRSVSHDQDYTKAHYAWDFYISKTMWPIYAAKSGYVYSFRDDVPNDEHSEVNFIVLQDADDPDLYQLYMHLAQDSIPPNLKQVGAQVAQGEYIATADNTGASTGHHLHFMVEIQPNWPPENPYWNQSVDITFDEVDIYGGRPRREFEHDPEFCQGPNDDYLCNEFGRLNYVSANEPSGDLTPPYGDLGGITTGDILLASTLVLTGWGADDDTGLDYGQLVADFDGGWHTVGDPFTSTFTYTWDVCSANAVVPDGAVSIALRLYDNAGNWEPLAGLRHFTKDYTCPQPPPVCVPGNEQVALFGEPNYGGRCTVFNVGDYPDQAALGEFWDDDAASILVGANVIATLYSEMDYEGHSEALASSDSYLADNLIGADSLSSMRIDMKSTLPSPPNGTTPMGDAFQEGDIIPLAWRNGGGATEYQVTVTPQTEALTTFPWQQVPFLNLDSLGQGTYEWQVLGRNAAGVSTASEPLTFTIGAADTPPATITAPVSDGFETNQDRWSGTGLWTLKDDGAMAHAGSYSWWYQGDDGDYDTGQPNSGNLTSPPISIPSAGTYYLRFYYRRETDTYFKWWDQRWVQISVDGGAFLPLLQLSEDPKTSEWQSWLKSPAIDLSEYAGHTIRVRFSFATLDEASNAYDGWGVDDFSITTTAPPTCTDLRQDDTPAEATALTYSMTFFTEGEICPGGDVDYYQFTGSEGDRIVVDVDAHDYGSSLDPYLVFYDSDGVSILAEEDDELLGEHRDPLLGYTLPHNGTYYFKIRAFDNPAVGGEDYYYSLRLFTDADVPAAAITYPAMGGYLPESPFMIEAQVTDPSDDLSHVDFYWHSNNWQIAAWTPLGTDWDDTDGWSYEFDPASLPEGTGTAFYIYAYDRAGNMASAGVWELYVDKTPPETAMEELPASQESTAILLEWTGTDNASGIDYYNLQSSLDQGAWEEYPQDISGTLNEAWFVGDAGSEYGFRMRGVDRVGNTESYPSTAEVTTTIPSAEVLCSTPDAYDSGGGDNSYTKATEITPSGGGQQHNFCNPLAADFLNDEDWAKFTVKSGHSYEVYALALGDQTAVVLSLYGSDGTTLQAESTPEGYGMNTLLEWTASQDGTVYLQAQHLDGRVIGNVVSYMVFVFDIAYRLYLPTTMK